MTKPEPILEFRLSRPKSFHCSFCGHKKDEGAFVITGGVAELLDAFKTHVETFHPAAEDFSQAAARTVKEATEKA
jgi:hypothetical protein